MFVETPSVNYAGHGSLGLVWNHLEFHFDTEGGGIGDTYVRDEPFGGVTDGELPASAESALELIPAK